MGIDGLLSRLKDAMEETHLRHFSGQHVVVDAFSWLHKACYGCAFELATGVPTDSYVSYMLRKVELLKSCGITDVTLVFDGQPVPLKASTHEKRREVKQSNHESAMKALARAKQLRGDQRQQEMSKVYQHFQRCISITPAILNTVMQALRKADIKHVVAPFEADAQLAWMCKTGLASAILTEDSDVLVYCMVCDATCPVLFKLDDAGNVQALSRAKLHANTRNTKCSFLKKVHFLANGSKESTRMFVQFCVFSGCDFLDSLPNIGPVTALKHIFDFRGAPSHLRVGRILAKLRSNGVKIESDFHERFLQAESLFFHHVIFNETGSKCEFLVMRRDTNCFQDLYTRARQCFEQFAPDFALPDPSQEEPEGEEELDLHGSQGSQTAFLGQVLTREETQQMYVGLRTSDQARPSVTKASVASSETCASTISGSALLSSPRAQVSDSHWRATCSVSSTEQATPRKRGSSTIEFSKEKRTQEASKSLRELLNVYRTPTPSTPSSSSCLDLQKQLPTSEPPSKPADLASTTTAKTTLRELSSMAVQLNTKPTSTATIKTRNVLSWPLQTTPNSAKKATATIVAQKQTTHTLKRTSTPTPSKKRRTMFQTKLFSS